MTTRHHARYQYVGTTAERLATTPPATGYGIKFFDTDLAVEYCWDGAAWIAPGAVHNGLAGLQGGAAGEYYHLTAAQHTAVGLMVTAGLDALTAAEVDQLENIGATTISAAQWGYLGAMDQGVATWDIVQFGGVGIRGLLAGAAGLYVPHVAGDLDTTALFGSTIAGMDQCAVWGQSHSNYGVIGESVSGNGGGFASTTGVGLYVNLSGAGAAIAQFADNAVVKVQIEDGGNITLAAGVTVDGVDLSAWLDQSVKQAAAPTFAGLTITAGDIDPTAASGQDLGDATHRWDLYATDADVSGSLVVGTGAATYRSNVHETSTAVAGNIIGDYILATMNPGGASAASLYGSYVRARMAGANNNNCTGTIAMYRGTADWYGTGTLTYLYGFWPTVVNRQAGSVSSAVGVSGNVQNISTGTITNAYGLRSEIKNTGGGTITTGLGLYISTVAATTAYGVYIGTVSGTTEYGIYQADASNKNYFAGKIGIGAAPAVSALLELSSTTGALLLTRMTTAQRNALTAVDGMVIYNTTTGNIEAREGGAWVNL